MLQTLAVRGYRGFESYRLANLARVNLLVGKNHCGKTSVLEAIELLVSGGHPSAFHDSLHRRGETGVQHVRRVRQRLMDISHVFFGHSCVPGASFDLSSDDGKRALSVKILSLEEVDEEADDWDPRVRRKLQMSMFDPDEDVTPMFGMSIDNGPHERQTILPVMEDGSIGLERHPRLVRNLSTETPVHFLTLDSFGPDSMGGMWNTVLAEGRETEIVHDMRLLEPGLD